MHTIHNNPRKRKVFKIDPTPPQSLSISDLPPRGRSREVAQERAVKERAKTTKILTISDLPRRNRRARRMVVPVVSPDSTYTRGAGVGDQLRPAIFADHVPDGVWKGRRCFIIGGGPSLKRLNLSCLAGELIIGINRAYELLDPSILYGVDGQLFGWAELGKLGAESRKQFRAYGGYKAWMALYKAFPGDFYLIDIDSSKSHQIGTTRRLAFLNNSGYGAINLAAALGAKEIYLLGFDMVGDKRGKQKWWHSGYPVDYGEGIYAKYVQEIGKLAPALKAAGVEVVNLNKRSKLQCFPFGDLSRVLAKRPKRPMVVSFYTRNTGYEKEAKRLIRELHLFGLEHDIQGIQSLGSWQANTQYKAKVIAGMLEKYSGRDILWLDVDSSIYQYPHVFDDADFDLGVHKIDWAKYTNGHRTDVQLANAVIYLRNIRVVKQFINAWVKLNEQYPNRIEMQTMAEMLDKWEDKLVYRNIPASYCQIYDMMASEGYPVIEQRQASRQYKNKVDITDPVVKREKKKYDDCWIKYYEHSSACAKPLVQHVLKTMHRGDKVLDIGCGDCTTIKGLREAGVDCMGVDISLAGVPAGVHGVFGAPVWDMPFEDDLFDYTVSTDVLEHVPTDLIPQAIKEIYRVTRRSTFHVVALFDGICKGVVLHMTVKPIEWWIDQFAAIKTKKGHEDMVVMARNMFMASYGSK